MDEETAKDIGNTIVGICHRQLHGYAPTDSAPDPDALAKTDRLPTAAVAYEPLFDIILRTLRAHQEPTSGSAGWAYSFVLDGRLCTLRWVKSGLKLDLFRHDGEHRNADLAAEGASIAARLMSAAKTFYRRIVAPRLDSSIAAGRAVVLNQAPRYRGMVDFHRQTIIAAETVEGAPAPAGTGTPLDAIHRFVGGMLAERHRDREQSYRATALVAGYFSWVQHLLVTLTAFSPTALHESFSLQELLDASWADQFDAAYPKPHDGASARLKSDLSALAHEFRNPLLHGGGGRFEDGLSVEWTPGHTIMAVNPDALTDQYMLLAPALTAAQIDDLLARIERIDTEFQQHPFYAWAEEGLHADFRQEEVQRAVDARDAGDASAFTRAASAAYDDSINWDR